MVAGRLNAELIATGTPIDETDVLIAATALVTEQPVVTGDITHFDRIDGIDIISY